MVFSAIVPFLQYAFTDSDRACALDNLKMFLEDGEMPWDALTFITGEVRRARRVCVCVCVCVCVGGCPGGSTGRVLGL